MSTGIGPSWARLGSDLGHFRAAASSTSSARNGALKGANSTEVGPMLATLGLPPDSFARASVWNDDERTQGVHPAGGPCARRMAAQRLRSRLIDVMGSTA